tara:strand:+ start:304 stop:654 length:351 start_codon:yes stop_codon:yes gene_type:complete
MKNKFLKDILAFLVVAFAFFVFISSSISKTVADAEVHIECSDYTNLEINKKQLEIDLPQLKGISKCKISPEVGIISIEYNSDDFNPSTIKQILDKWEINPQNEEEWQFEIIASSDF